MMKAQEAQKRISLLKEKIKTLNYDYFVLDKSTVNESVRDSLKRELIGLEAEFPQFVTEDSPTQRVGSVLSGKFAKIRHLTVKKSLSDVFSSEEIERLEKHDLNKIDILYWRNTDLNFNNLDNLIHSLEKKTSNQFLRRINDCEDEKVLKFLIKNITGDTCKIIASY